MWSPPKALAPSCALRGRSGGNPFLAGIRWRSVYFREFGAVPGLRAETGTDQQEWESLLLPGGREVQARSRPGPALGFLPLNSGRDLLRATLVISQPERIAEMLGLTALSHLGNRGGNSCLWEKEIFAYATVLVHFSVTQRQIQVMHGHAHHGVGSAQAAGVAL